MDRYPSFNSDGWHKSELYDYSCAKSDEERRKMLLIFGFDEAHRKDARKLFPDMPN